MKIIKILHIASFNGNIGDNANHNGFRNRLRNKLSCDIQFREIEMREFYHSWNLRDFNNDEFIRLCNNHDLVIIGGGNFFELKWDYSYTGTTINIRKDTLDKIKTPVLFNALGCDTAKGCNGETVAKFGMFLEQITESEKVLVSVRNDGSYDTINKLYAGRFIDNIFRVPDGAFFIKTRQFKFPELNGAARSIGINVASDMKDIRFKEDASGGISYSEFIKELAGEMNDFLMRYKEYQLIFFPHIYSDLTAVSDMLEYMEDRFRRTRIRVAPCLTGFGAEEYIFGLYKRCDMVMGMRFHSNVCSIAQNIPTIALSSYKKINDLYEELGLTDRIVEVNKADFMEKLWYKLQSTLSELDEIKARYREVNEKLYMESEEYFSAVKSWCEKNRII